tara:strand:- start:1172 stop:2179 length:1008 start_codon:yes stop_codon:yes gene_type:complete
MLFFLLFFSCGSENVMAHKVSEIEYVEVEVEKEVEVVVKETVPFAVIVEKEVVVYDTADNAADVWVENFTQPTSVNGVDILWVIDPSGSMHDDVPRILDGIDAMMNALPSTGWRLAIIPSDYRFSEGVQEFPLIPGDTVAMAESMYNAVVYGAHEAGFDAVYGYIINNTYAQTWMRDDAALLIVFVSDEDEQSNKYFNSTSQFMSWASAYRENVFLASIVHLDPSLSLCNMVAGFTGDEYMAATNHFAGQVIDICSEDWSAGVADASNQVAPYEHWDLAKTPLYDDRIYIFIDGVSVPETDGVDTFWHYNSTENRIYFDKIPPANALVEIAYYYE